MPASTCRFVKRMAECVPRELWDNVPDNTRGIYALLQLQPTGAFDVVYIGMSAGKKAGMYSRLKNHLKRKSGWSHFTIYEVHDNITDSEIRELEGLFRHMYRMESRPNKLNKQLRHKPFDKIKVTKKILSIWGWEENYKSVSRSENFSS